MRDSFGSKIGLVLATAGSAVGLGNVWRFPFMAGQNGGAAFIIIYIFFIVILGVPGMVSEFIVGRHAGTNAARAYSRLSTGRQWKHVGVMGIVTSTIILGFYAVVAGWCLNYLFVSIGGDIGGDASSVRQYFVQFSSSPVSPVLWGLTFIVLTHLVIVRGIRSGIEKFSKLMMPTMFVLLIVLVVASCMLPGSMKGVAFLLNPDFSKVDGHVFLAALGQAFFSLSLGTACLCTYSSYFSRSTNLVRSAVQIAFIDTLVAILAGLMIFPAAFSVGINPDSGPSLIFITLPCVFHEAFAGMPVLGYVTSILFYALLSLAALKSTISMHEIGTAFFHEELNKSRKTAACYVSALAAVICIVSSFSVGYMPGLQLFGMSMMDCFDKLTAQLLLPLGGFLTCIYIGWFASFPRVYEEFTNDSTVNRSLFRVYLFLVRYVCPTFILAIFLDQFGLL